MATVEAADSPRPERPTRMQPFVRAAPGAAAVILAGRAARARR